MLHAERLTCIVDDRPLFAALTLSLAAGELLQVAGDNGAGKTSLLRILCGLARPESGVVSWQGSRWRRSGSHFIVSCCGWAINPASTRR
jgi:heme exporter protein A